MKFVLNIENEKSFNSDLFPEGLNEVEIYNVEHRISKQGNEVLTVTLALIDGVGICDFNLTMLEGKRWRLRELLIATNCYQKDASGSYVFDTDDLKGKVVKALIKNIEDQFVDKTGEQRTKLKSTIVRFMNDNHNSSKINNEKKEAVDVNNDMTPPPIKYSDVEFL
jgi:hypothetical protein